MTTMSPHAEWLSLIDVSGPFLAEPVLNDAFPQGLEELESKKRRMLRQAYDEWREALDLEEPDLPEIHTAWIDLVLKKGLELDEDDKGDVFKSQTNLPEALCCKVPEHGITLRPDFAVVNDQKDDEPLMLIAVYGSEVPLDEAVRGDGWATSPAERMVELCRAVGVRLGLVTNGERWMFVDAPVGAVTTFASWYARLWSQEPKTLQAFVNLLGIRRFFLDQSEQLPSLLDKSLEHQDAVTDALGEQVRRAVEVLIQALDRADVDRNRELLEGVDPTELYEAGLSIMMRIVFLLSAEERGLLLLGDERYEANYAVSTLRLQLRGESEEILERRWDAWSRLLSIFRAVYGGIEHEALRLPALGGSLFDPDRFPFLEGRSKGSHWKTDPAIPLPIDNRTVLLLLDAVQLFQGRTLSYRALDVEQIGYVYEGLLERTVVRAKEVTLDLDATKSAKKPWVSLDELEAAAAKSGGALADLLKERMGSSASRIANDLKKAVDEDAADKLLTACHGDQTLRDRIRPYFHLLRIDRWGYPLVYPEGTFMVATGADRRETGTHYTPKSLTESIVKETLKPVVYIGPAEGKPRKEWQLKSPAELLDLKICDPAMGSGAFLVQACRWLSERLVEAWEQSEATGSAVTSEGEVVEKQNGLEPLRNDPEERLLTARRLIAERCLYGVDVNPLAVELAKLSIWLVTLAKGRPFGFLDHNLRSGDSLIGIHDLEQLHYLDLSPGKGSSKKLFASKIDEALQQAMSLRSDLRSRPIYDIRDVEVMARLDEQARQKLELPELIADALVGETLEASGQGVDTTVLSIEAGGAMEGDGGKIEALELRANKGLNIDLPVGKPVRAPFHWSLEFPEVFRNENAGFDAIVGNPPFLGGQKITGVMGTVYREYLVEQIADGVRGSADLVSYFFLKAFSLLKNKGVFGLLAVNTIAEGNTREIGLDQLLSRGGIIIAAYPSEVWPGSANVVTSRVHVAKGKWSGGKTLSGERVLHISSYLGSTETWTPVKLSSNSGIAFMGSIILGDGFLIDEDLAKFFQSKDRRYHDVLYPYLIGQEVNQTPKHAPGRWVINFFDWSLENCERNYPELVEIVRRKVKPEREKQKNVGAKKKWWIHYRFGFDLYHAIGLGKFYNSHPHGWVHKESYPERVIVFATGATKYPCFTFVPNKYIYAHSLCIIARESYALFACLSSDIHAVWAWEHGSKMKQDLRYTHGDIFETFPFPSGVLKNDSPKLSELGQQFFHMRCNYMEEQEKGMTKFYNDFHNPSIQDGDIMKCRKAQIRINEAVLSAYGFEDLELEQGFHKVPYLPTGKNTRFTISESARNELLKRLALLNKLRDKEEGQGQKPGTNVRKISMEKVAVGDDLFTAQRGTP
ncbi:MAG: hypothetical protein KC643_23225 [Nitrospira sp.]|nr:hypothetical protein [Nitrospira sp.]